MTRQNGFAIRGFRQLAGITVTTETMRALGPVALVITRTNASGRWTRRTRVVWAR